ncbi:MAG: glycoside hydrolase family 19 protein, partial [bacterium]
MQAALSRLGFPVGQTSQYGPTTEALVTQFQRTYKVGQTGKVGKTTLGVLTKAIPASVSLAEFQAMSPGIDPEVARTYLPHLNASMLQANITTDARKAAYVAQLGHESDGFNTLEEYASGADYEGRGDLGNTQKGDGKRFKGRGPIQITGRANYREYGQAIGVDLIQNPEVAATPEVGFQLAAEYWKRKDLNRYA